MQLELQELLASKAFDQLNEEERSFVLQQLSEQEYRAQYRVVTESRALFQTESARIVPLPPTAALAALKQQQAPPVSNTSPVQPIARPKLWQYPVPLWQAAAACLFFVLSYGMLSYNNNTKTTRTEIATVIRDTIFVDKIKAVFRPADTIVKVIYDTLYIKESPVEEAAYAALADSAVRREEVVLEAAGFEQSMDYYTTSSGQPMSKDTFLQLFSRVVTY